MGKQLIKNCLYCGGEFISYACQNRRYCSNKCSTAARGRPKAFQRECPQCEREFTTIPSINKKFCSQKCCAIYYGKKRKAENAKHIYASYPERITVAGQRKKLSRYLMERKINRELLPLETIHHIDLDIQNNPEDCSNYYLYPDNSSHIKGHRSLDKLVPFLLKKKIIIFMNGIYEIANNE